LKQLIALADGATQGEWEANQRSFGRPYIHTHANGERTPTVETLGRCQGLIGRKNSRFIAAANPQTVKAMAELLEQCEDVLRQRMTKGAYYEMKATLAAIQAFKAASTQED